MITTNYIKNYVKFIILIVSLDNLKIKYGLEVRDDFKINNIKILINKKKLLIKIDLNSNLLEFYLIFKYYIEKWKNGENLITSIYLVKIDSNLEIKKRKLTYSKTELLDNFSKTGENLILSYDYFIEILNEINETDFYDSDSSFQGEILGLELRFRKDLIIDKNSEIKKINTIIKNEI